MRAVIPMSREALTRLAIAQAVYKAMGDQLATNGGKHGNNIRTEADAMLGFSDGTYRVIVSKPSICGFGMNWQGCHQMAFCGLSYSYEQFYQAVRRCWRFGQPSPVDVLVFSTERESGVVATIEEKERRRNEGS